MPAELELVAADGAHPQLDAQAAACEITCITLGLFISESFAHPFDVLQRPQHTAHALEVTRAGLELARWVLGAGRTLYTVRLSSRS